MLIIFYDTMIYFPAELATLWISSLIIDTVFTTYLKLKKLVLHSKTTFFTFKSI